MSLTEYDMDGNKITDEKGNYDPMRFFTVVAEEENMAKHMDANGKCRFHNAFRREHRGVVNKKFFFDSPTHYETLTGNKVPADLISEWQRQRDVTFTSELTDSSAFPERERY